MAARKPSPSPSQPGPQPKFPDLQDPELDRTSPHLSCVREPVFSALANHNLCSKIVKKFKPRFVAWAKPTISDPINRLIDDLSTSNSSSLLRQGGFTLTTALVRSLLCDRTNLTSVRYIAHKMMLPPIVRSFKYFRLQLVAAHPDPEEIETDHLYALWTYLSNSREVHRAISAHAIFQRTFASVLRGTGINRLLDNGLDLLWDTFSLVMSAPLVQMHDLTNYAKPRVHNKHLDASFKFVLTAWWKSYTPDNPDHTFNQVFSLFINCIDNRHVFRIDYTEVHAQSLQALAHTFKKLDVLVDAYLEDTGPETQGFTDILHSFATFIAGILDTPVFWLVAAIACLVKALSTNNRLTAAAFITAGSLCTGMLVSTGIHSARFVVDQLLGDKAFTARDLGFFSNLVAAFKPIYKEIAVRLPLSPPAEDPDVVQLLPSVHGENPFLTLASCAFDEVPAPIIARDANAFLNEFLMKTGLSTDDLTRDLGAPGFQAYSLPAHELTPTTVRTMGFVCANLTVLAAHDAVLPLARPDYRQGLSLVELAGLFQITGSELGILWTIQAALNLGLVPTRTDDGTDWHFAPAKTATVLDWQTTFHEFLSNHAITCLFDAYRNEHTRTPETGFSSLADHLVVKGTLEDALAKLVANYLAPQTQHEDAGVPFLNFFVSLAGAFGKTISKASLARYGQQFSSLWRAFTDGRALIDYITPFFTIVINALAGLLGYPPLFVNHMKEAIEMVTSHNAAITELNTVALSVEEDISGAIAKANDLCELLPKLDALLAHVPAKEAVHKDANLMKAKLQKLLELLVSQDAARRPRCEPVGVLFPGRAGIGKSQFAHFLTKSLMSVDTPTGPQAYLRNEGIGQVDLRANFQDGIRHQATWMLDEFLTVNDSTSRMQHVGFLLDNINCTQRLVEKAAIEDKAKYWVSNQMLILTTNCDLNVVNNLVPDMTAIKRRIDVVVDIHPPPHVNGRFPSLADGSIDWSQFSFNVLPFDMASGDHIEVPSLTNLTALGVVRHVATLLANRGRDYATAMSKGQHVVFKTVGVQTQLPPPCVPEVHVPSILPRASLTSALPKPVATTTAVGPGGLVVSLPARFPDVHDSRDTQADMDKIAATWTPASRAKEFEMSADLTTDSTSFWATLDEVVRFGLPHNTPPDRATYVAYMAANPSGPFDWRTPDSWADPFAPDADRPAGPEVWYDDTALAFAALSLYDRRTTPWTTGNVTTIHTPWALHKMANPPQNPPAAPVTPATPAHTVASKRKARDDSATASSSAPAFPPAPLPATASSTPPPPLPPPISAATLPSAHPDDLCLTPSSLDPSPTPPASSDNDEAPECQGPYQHKPYTVGDFQVLAAKWSDPSYPYVTAREFFNRVISAMLRRDEVTSIGCYPLFPVGHEPDSLVYKVALHVRQHHKASPAVQYWVSQWFSYGANYIVDVLKSIVSFDGIRTRLRELSDYISSGVRKATSSLSGRFVNALITSPILGHPFIGKILYGPAMAFETLTGINLSPSAMLLSGFATGVFILAIAGVAVGLSAYWIVNKLTSGPAPSRDVRPYEFTPPKPLEHQAIRYGSGDQERFQDRDHETRRRRPGHKHRHGRHYAPTFGGTSMMPVAQSPSLIRSGPPVSYDHNEEPPAVQGPDTHCALAVRGLCWLTTSDNLSYRCFGVYGRMIVFPHHYSFAFRRDPVVTYSDARVTVKIDTRTIARAEDPNRDLLYFWLPNTVPAFPDILHRFIDEEDLDKLPSTVEFHLIERHKTHESHITKVAGVPVVHSWSIRGCDAENKYNGKFHYVGLAVVTKMQRVNGDCGSVYTASSPHLAPRCILGIHVAGNSTSSYCSVITLDQLCDAIDILVTDPETPTCQGPDAMRKRIAPNAVPYSDEDGDDIVVTFRTPTGDWDGEDNFEAPLAPHTGLYQEPSRVWEERRDVEERHIASLMDGESIAYPPSALYIGRSHQFVRSSTESRYVPGPLAPYLNPPEYSDRPALLAPTDGGIDPLALALRRQVHLVVEQVDETLMAEAATAVFSYVRDHSRRRVWTMEEAIIGKSCLGSLDADAAPGVPWDSIAASMRKPAKKGTFFDVERAEVLRRNGSTRERVALDVHPTLISAVNRAMSLLADGKCPDWMMKCALKDEIVPEEKVTVGKTRMYYVAPIEHAIVCRMLFGDLIAQTMIDRVTYPGKVSCAVGVAPNDGTIRAFHTVASKGESFAFAADQKGWDNHQHYELARFLAKAINDWYPAREPISVKTARTTFIKSCYNSLYVLNGVVYRMPFGLPSGVAFTSQMNSWYLEMVTLYSAFKALPPTLTPKLDMCTLKRETFAFYYGDDSWVLFPQCWGLTSSAIFAEMTKLGLEATHSIKNWPRTSEVPYERQTFLKRTIFTNADGHLVWALPLSVIEGQFAWTLRKHLNSRSVLMSVITSHLEESALYGKEYFEDRVKKITSACHEHGITLDVSTSISAYSSRFL